MVMGESDQITKPYQQSQAPTIEILKFLIFILAKI